MDTLNSLRGQCWCWERKVSLSHRITSFLVVDLGPGWHTEESRSNWHHSTGQSPTWRENKQVPLNMWALPSQSLWIWGSLGCIFFSRTAYEDPKSPSFVQINSLRHQWRVGLLECQVPRFYLHFSTSESYGNWSWVFVFPPRFCENKFHVQIVSWPPFPSQARTGMCIWLRYRYPLLQPCVQSHDWVQTQNTFSSWNSAAFWQVNHFWWVRGHGNSGALRVLPVESSHVNAEGIIAQRVK